MKIVRDNALSAFIFFLLCFSYATAVALLFQKFLLPLAGGLHSGQGLLQGDSAYFHSVAVDLAERIRAHGWSQWQLYPATGATGNVSLLAGLYVWFGADPSLMVPVNAALHALSGTLLFMIGRLLWPGRVGILAGLAAGTLFVVFPSALNWYGQLHKDGFAIAGAALILYAWVLSESERLEWRQAVVAMGCVIAGAALEIVVRPYNLLLILAGVLAMLVVKVVLAWPQRRVSFTGRSFVLQLVLVTLVTCAVIVSPRTGAGEQSYAEWDPPTATTATTAAAAAATTAAAAAAAAWKWQPSSWIPQNVEKYIEVLARTRAGLISYNLSIQAGSLYDADRLPASTLEVLAYAPRALQIALFAPFPVHWLEKLSALRMLAIGETAVWYLIVPGLLLAAWLGRSLKLGMVAVFALSLLVFYGTTSANIGTLYRVRYFYLFLMLLIGLAGWLLYFERRGWLARAAAAWARKASVPVVVGGQMRQARTNLVASGVVVALVTGLGFVGLFLRDVLMARYFGLGAELDAFVVASVVPMFLVAVLSVPLSTSIVPGFLRVRERFSMFAAQALVRKIGLFYLVCAVVLAGILGLMGSYLLDMVGWTAQHPDKAALTQVLILWMLGIFVISGLITLANGLLNAMGHSVVPAAAQVIVPLVAIAGLLVFGRSHGVLAVAVAMLAGQLINLFIVHLVLTKQGVALWSLRSGYPDSVDDAVSPRPFVGQYLPLVVAAIFMQFALPVATAMAAALPEGSVAALGLGSKMTVFMTGLIGAAIASVVLPYFSQQMAQNRLLDARRELSFLLLAGTIVAIPFTLMLHIVSEPLVRLVFEGGLFKSADAEVVSRVMAYGVLQLPFFVVNMILLKFAIASHHSGRVMLAALVGLVVLMGLSMMLMNRMGAPGLALAMALSVAVTAGSMLLLFCRLGDVDWMDMIFIGANWMLFFAAVVCLHYESFPGLLASCLAFALLLFGEYVRTHERTGIAA
jgi:murein biosynthesis integral membrane protein MurJ